MKFALLQAAADK